MTQTKETRFAIYTNVGNRLTVLYADNLQHALQKFDREYRRGNESITSVQAQNKKGNWVEQQQTQRL